MTLSRSFDVFGDYVRELILDSNEVLDVLLSELFKLF